ncbi:MAG: PAS domain S-box protein [Mariprofundaceae bacterium]|nr:PAS domain S-box protein [Mariprofundaceae bacterium]
MHVLILEDIPTDAELAKRELQSVLKDFIVKVVDTEDDFLQALKSYKPDLIISDYMMPNFNGLSALKIREVKCSQIPFVILTGSVNEEIAVECMKAGADDYVIKEHIKRLGPAVINAIEKKRKERIREQAKEELRMAQCIVSTSGDIMALLDRDFIYHTANKAYLDAVNKRADEVIGKSAQDVMGEKLFKNVIKPNAVRCLAGEKVNYQEWFNFPSQEDVYLDVHYYPYTDANHNISGFVVNGRDITKQARAKQAIKDSEEKFRSVTEAVQDSIIMIDSDGIVVFWNLTSEKMTGFSSEDALGKKLDQLIIPESYCKLHLDGLTSFSKTGQGPYIGKTIEVSAVHKSGKAFPVELSLSAIKRDNHWYAAGILRDITERKHAEQVIRDSEEQTRLILDSTTEAIYGMDTDGLCTMVNTACVAMLGYDDSSELVGNDIHDLIHHTRKDGSPYPKNECRMIKAFIENKELHVDDEVLWRKDGSSFPASYWSHPIQKNGKTTGSVVAFLDITEQINSQHDLKESHDSLLRSLEGTIQAIAMAVEARDPYTAGHQRRVANIAVIIAREMGLDDKIVTGILWGATIHDIGKIHLPAEILSKPSRLSKLEYSLIQEHAQVGYEILKNIKFPWPIANIAHQHHERIDGSGYPQGLKGDEICLEARIVAVADVVEAISSHRPYRAALGIEVALDEIKAKRGIFYDPAAVDACLKACEENKLDL